MEKEVDKKAPEKVDEKVVIKTPEKVEMKKEEKKDETAAYLEQAKAIFEAMPHILTIWFNKQGEWRFYKTPGSVPVHKENIKK